MSQGVAKKMKMDEKRLNILDLNNDCLLVIMKYIIAEGKVSPDHPSRYADMENFAMVDGNIKELLRIYFKEVYYHRELTKVANKIALRLDFAQLQSTIANKNEGDSYWKLYAEALRKNSLIRVVNLSLDPESAYPEFPKHFQLIKSSLENNESLTELALAFNGYTLDNLNNFEHLTTLSLDVRMSAEALVSVCQSAPLLYDLKIMSTEIQGRLSDIVPHCRNLENLTFVPKPNVDLSEYAPLTELPNLNEISIHGAYTNGSLLSMFQAIKDWRRSKTSPLKVNFTDVLPPLSSVTMAKMNVMHSLGCSLMTHGPDRIELKTCYWFSEVSGDSRPIEESPATMIVSAASFDIYWPSNRFILLGCPISDIKNVISVLKQFNLNNLTISLIDDYKHEETLIQKLFGTMVSDGLVTLKSICIAEADEYSCEMPLMDQLATRELVRINSITFLNCSFFDWEPVELLGELTNLQAANIDIKKPFEKTSAKAICNLLNTCQVWTFICCDDWIIRFKKSDGIPGPSNGINTLKISEPEQGGFQKKEALNEVFEALAHRTFNANDELDISNFHLVLNFKDINKVSEIQSLKKLKIKLSDANGIEQLSKLTELEELTIKHTGSGSLIKLFDQLAKKESPSLQCLKLSLINISPFEVVSISRIRSLKKLEFYIPAADCEIMTELANSNIEELTFTVPNLSLQKLLKEIGKNSTTRLRHLKNYSRTLDLMELTELSKLKGLSSLHTLDLNSQTLPYLRELQNLETLNIDQFRSGDLKLHLPTLKTLVINSPIGLMGCKCLGNLENLESLTLSLDEANGIHDLCKIKSLKKLIIKEASHSLGSVFKELACNGGMKLEDLSVPIRGLEEVQGVTGMKSLKRLHLRIITGSYSDQRQPIELGQLTKLESLYIEKENRELEFKFCLDIFESCKNLSICTIKCNFDDDDYFVRKVHTLLQSIRDPAIQDPLLLVVIFNGNTLENQLDYIDDEYLKVYYIPSNVGA